MFFHKISLVFMAVLALLMGTSVTHAEDRKVSVGMAASDGAVDFTFKSARLGGFEHATVYTTLGKDKLEYVKFPKEFGIILVLRIPHEGQGGNLAKIKDGFYDDQLHELVQKINADGRPITLRVLPEFNGHWYSWSVYNKENNPADFVLAWKHVVEVVRAATKLVRFDLNYNRFSSHGGRTNDFASLYPGDAWVDQVSISSYNRCGIVQGNDSPHSFAEEFAPAYEALVGIVGESMPIVVAETSTTSLCGVDKKEWFVDLFDSIETRFTRVSNITFFFTPKQPGTASNDIVVHWDLENAAEVAMFRNILADFRKRMRITPPKPPVGQLLKKTDGTAVNETVIPKKSAVRMPWSIWGRIEAPIKDAANPEFNPTTGDPFDTMGLRLRFRATQGIMWDIPDSFGLSYGFEGSVAGVASTNPDRWWEG
ncbi:MAG: hypothetical protein RLZZ342_135, partial [Candidatus Parcubacteria bacterium]